MFVTSMFLLLMACTTTCGAIPWTCATDADCGVQDAYCISGVCSCTGEKVFSADKTRCLPIALIPYESECIEDVQCSERMLSGAECVLVKGVRQCQCTAGYHHLHGRCWRSKRLGEDCTQHAQCFVGYNHGAARCGAASKLCECSPGFYQHGSDDCRRNMDSEEECLMDSDCTANKGTCISSVCKLTIAAATRPAATKNNTNASVVLDVLDGSPLLGKACEQSSDCANNQICLDSVCACSPAHYNKNNKCLPELGEKCSIDEDCSLVPTAMCRVVRPAQGSVPAVKVCSCPVTKTAAATNRKCSLAKAYGNSCQDDQSCAGWGPLCGCQGQDFKRRCTCLQGSHWESTPLVCWRDVHLGGKCTYDNDCAPTAGKATCNALGVCECANTFHSTTDNQACVENVDELGDNCLEDRDCTMFDEHSTCYNQACDCRPPYFAVNGSCVTGVGGACKTGSDCEAVNNNFCNSTTELCSCESGFVPSSDSGSCLPDATDIGDPCTADPQCTDTFGPHSECKNGTCDCTADFFEQQKVCWKKVVLGQHCAHSLECYMDSPTLLPNVECLNGICTCKAGTVRSGNSACVSKSSKHHSIGTMALLTALVTLRRLW